MVLPGTFHESCTVLPLYLLFPFMESKDFRISFGSHGTEPHQKNSILSHRAGWLQGPKQLGNFSWLNWGYRQEQLLQFLPSIVRIFGSYASWYLILAGGFRVVFRSVVKLPISPGNPFRTIGNPETHPAIEACHGERFHWTKDATMDPQIVLHCGGSKCQWQGNGKRQQEVVDVFLEDWFLNRSSIVGFAKLLLLT